MPNQDAAVDSASKLDTATISDALDKLGIAGQCLNIKPRDHRFRLTGRAFTILYGPVGKPAGTVGEFIDDVAPGSVIAIDNGGRENATVWGDILTEIADRRGIAGTVIDGACRDTALCFELGYPIYSRSYSMRTGKDRVQLDATEITITIGDARVSPGDILRGDSDGVVVIPRRHEAEILALAEKIAKAEDAIRNAVRNGKGLAEARKQHGYHQLQSRQK